ncbi:uncharacterized protein LOC120346194 isoform X1 [Styela clava]
MSSKASGDAPQSETKRITEKKDDIYNWRMSYEAWQTFNDLREKGLFYDVTLVTDDQQKFSAHRIVLCTCGHYFRSLFSGRWKSSSQKEIRIPGVNATMMKCVIQFAYTRSIKLNSISEAKELLIVGNHFGVDEMMKICAHYLTQKMKPKNCLEFWEFARIYYCKELEMKAFLFILSNFQSLANLQESCSGKTLMELDADSLRKILENDELNVKNEKLPLRVVLSWASSPINRHRQTDFFNLLFSVRLGLLKAEFIEAFVRNHDLVISSARSRSLIEKQIHLSRMKENLGDNKAAFTKFATDVGTKLFNADISFPPTSLECDILRLTSRPRFPREVILVVGGWSGNAPTSSSEAYDPVTRTWCDTNIAFPTLLKKPRAYHGVCYLDGMLYVVGGFDGQLTYNSCDRYNLISGKWKKMCGMHHRRCYVGVAELDKLIYAVGGSEGGGEHLRLKSAEKYDPNVNVWTRLPDMTERRSDAGVCGLSGKIYVAGGFTGHQCVFSVEYFDTESQQWSRIIPMRIPRSGVTVIAYKNRVLALGGFDGNSSRLNSVEAYDPQLNLWTTWPDMSTGRSNFGACVLGGKLTVMGGFNGVSTCCNVEYFDDEGDSDDVIAGGSDAEVPGPSNRLARHGNDSPSYEGNGSGDNDEDNADGLRHVLRLQNLRPENLPANREIPTGVWRRLPDMKISRSALSCCVVKNLPPPFLRSVVAPLESSGHHPVAGSTQQWDALDRLMAVCIQNTFHNS